MARPLNSASRLRFAPSPTGTLHVGGARTALFNWLLARGCGGTFILRIEDTDRERSTEASVETILDGLRWLSLDWDEGPYFQSQRGEHYLAAINQLLERGHAYPCFCLQERLDALRVEAEKKKVPFVYDGFCRHLPVSEAEERSKRGDPHTIRFKIQAGSVTEFEDVIGGKRSFENDRLGDFVVRRSDGSPIYHMTVVVDDHEMGITHVVRGDDHVPNTPRQMLIFQALGWGVPDYGHLPLIQGPDRARLSKRHGAASVMEFAAEGFLPQAMFNYLSLLGWSLDSETELMTREQLIKSFSLERVNRSAAIFDRAKLEWMNSMYLRALPLDEVVSLAREFFREAGVDSRYLHEAWLKSIVALEIERSRTLKEMLQNLDYFFREDLEGYEEKGAQKHLLAEGSEGILCKLEEELAAAPGFDPADLEPCLRKLGEEMGLSFGKLVHPLRLALTGRSASPGIFEVLAALGRASSLDRILKARKWIERQRATAPAEPEGAK